MQDPDGTQTFNYPAQLISIENAMIEIDQKYGEDGSALYVSIFAERKQKRITLTVVYMQSIVEAIETENEQT